MKLGKQKTVYISLGDMKSFRGFILKLAQYKRNGVRILFIDPKNDSQDLFEKANFCADLLLELTEI